MANYAKAASEQSTTDFLLHIIPQTFTDAFTGSGVFTSRLVAVLFGYAMMRMGKTGQAVHMFIEEA